MAKSEREWWGRFEDLAGRRTERVELERFSEKATFKAEDIDFVEITAREGTPQIVVISATQIAQLEAEWLVLQPDLVRQNPSQGWEALGDRFENAQFLGSEEQTALRFQEKEEATVCMIRSLGPDAFEIESFSEQPLELVAFPPVVVQ